MAIDERILRNALVALAEQCKQQYIELMEAIDEVGLLQKAMQHLERRYEKILAQQKTVLKTIQLRAGAIERLDEIIHRIGTHAIHDL